MNWVGGARKRLSVNSEKKVQQQFFQKRREEKKIRYKRSFGSSTSCKSNGFAISQDMLSLQTIIRTHDNALKKKGVSINDRPKPRHIEIVNRKNFSQIQHNVSQLSTSPVQTNSKIELDNVRNIKNPQQQQSERPKTIAFAKGTGFLASQPNFNNNNYNSSSVSSLIIDNDSQRFQKNEIDCSSRGFKRRPVLSSTPFNSAPEKRKPSYFKLYEEHHQPQNHVESRTFGYSTLTNTRYIDEVEPMDDYQPSVLYNDIKTPKLTLVTRLEQPTGPPKQAISSPPKLLIQHQQREKVIKTTNLNNSLENLNERKLSTNHTPYLSSDEDVQLFNTRLKSLLSEDKNNDKFNPYTTPGNHSKSKLSDFVKQPNKMQHPVEDFQRQLNKCLGDSIDEESEGSWEECSSSDRESSDEDTPKPSLPGHENIVKNSKEKSKENVVILTSSTTEASLQTSRDFDSTKDSSMEVQRTANAIDTSSSDLNRVVEPTNDSSIDLQIELAKDGLNYEEGQENIDASSTIIDTSVELEKEANLLVQNTLLVASTKPLHGGRSKSSVSCDNELNGTCGKTLHDSCKSSGDNDDPQSLISSEKAQRDKPEVIDNGLNSGNYGKNKLEDRVHLILTELTKRDFLIYELQLAVKSFILAKEE